jgi:hypothetical protein
VFQALASGSQRTARERFGISRYSPARSAPHEYQLPDATQEALTGYFEFLPRTRGFGNGRLARQVFQRMTENQAQRVADLPEPTTDDILWLLPEDIPPAGADSDR